MIYTAPENIAYRDRTKRSIFLGGTIEMGNSHNWQGDVIKKLSIAKKTVGFGSSDETESDSSFNIFNPRREDWDSRWEQSILAPQFYQQVEWELTAMEKANYIIMYFDPTSRSPVSMLELGLHAGSGKLLVCCPEGFWRKGNIDIVCSGYNVQMFETLDDIVSFLKNN
jgi:hypothetical protein